MKLKPILFSTPMVRAILEGRKTQTRRILKIQPDDRGVRMTSVLFEDYHGNELKPKYQKGDILWVKETWRYTDASLNDHPGYVYRASDPDWETLEGWKWKPSIHMPKEAARIFLKVTNVRAERLQDISEEDAIAEGVERISVAPFVHRFKNYVDDEELEFAESSFRTLWESINGKESWNENPFVWVYEFERIEKPIPCDN